MSLQQRRSVSADRPWASAVAYSRAIRIGNMVEIGGTTATTPTGAVLHPGDLYMQTAECLSIIGTALTELGSSFADVIRTRVYLTDINRWREAARAHEEVFHGIDPVSTFVEIRRLLDPDLLIEIEATAVIPE